MVTRPAGGVRRNIIMYNLQCADLSKYQICRLVWLVGARAKAPMEGPNLGLPKTIQKVEPLAEMCKKDVDYANTV